MINLLPREVAPTKGQKKVASAANKIAAFFCGVFILMVLLGGGLYLFFNSRLNQVKSEADELAANIQSLQSTESSLILLKDRAQKAAAILTSRENEGYFTKQNQIVNTASTDVVFDGSEVMDGKSSLEVKILNSQSLVGLFAALRSSSNFSSLVVDELSFSPTVGYSVTLNVY
jgi:hypothetical protein